MSYTIREVQDLETFSAMIRVVWTAYHHPYKPYFSAYFPVFGPTAADREAAIQASIERKWKAYQADPDSRWIAAVLDQPQGASSSEPKSSSAAAVVIGACQWLLYDTSPYVVGRNPHSYDADMWPEGSVGKDFVTAMELRHFGHQRRWLRRRHARCQTMSVLPTYRRRGIGAALMKWGMEQAAQMGLEVFIHASDDSRFIYERFGLRVVEKHDLDMRRENASDEWERLCHDFGGLRYYAMWKPAEGIYKEGQTPLPWENTG